MQTSLDRQQQPPTLSRYRYGLMVVSGMMLGLTMACSGGGGGGGTPAPTITSFVAAPTILTTGDTTTPITLTGVFANGTGAVDQGVGTVTSGTAVNVTPAATTLYTLTVTNSAGTAVTQTATVTFVAAPTTPTITPTTDVTANSTGNLASVPTQTGSTYAWTITNGVITAGDATNSITFTAGATGTVHLTCIVTNAAGLASTPGAVDRTIVAAGPSLTVTITGLNPADVAFTGRPNLTATTTIPSLADGTYTITANDVVTAGPVTRYPWQRTQTVTVTGGIPTPNAVTVFYPEPTLTVQIPDVTAAPATVPMDFVLVPPGTFTMGAAANTDDSNWLDATAQHSVTIPHAFYVAKFECTQAQWMAVTGSNPSIFLGNLQRPVDRVDWDRIRVEYLPGAPTGFSYLQKLNAATGRSFRLPSEAEHEYVVRAGTSTNYFFGDIFTDGLGLSAYAWYGLDKTTTNPVGLLAPNPWGLYDIIGNVWEWCEDDAHGTVHHGGPFTTDETGYLGAPTDGTAWVDASRGLGRILRGGGWSGDDNTSPRSAFRWVQDHNYREDRFGFRVVMDIVP